MGCEDDLSSIMGNTPSESSQKVG
ncbi:uncharacterized protein G2W53_035880 [Senna tora]|uniref:Uncharacterized protein n=1 Tax=Senna tora TaxID=362788 RepID=A0A834W4I7_9FABA|nr:uncharacterized protein G2W53_035880 [Senna tora]